MTPILIEKPQYTSYNRIINKKWLFSDAFIVKIYKTGTNDKVKEKIMVMTNRGGIDENGKGL